MQRRRLSLSAIQVAASVLAAMSGALAASYLGITSTIIGAAVVSFASTVGTAVYRHVLGRTGDRIRSAAAGRAMSRAGAPGKPGGVPPWVRARLAELREAGSEARPAPGLGERPGGAGRAHPTGGGPGGRRRWLVLLGAIAGTFVISMALITGIELAVGKPLDSILWHRHGTGTSVGTVINGPAKPRRGTPHAPRPARATQPAPARSVTTHPVATTPAPTPAATPSPTHSRTPSPTPSRTPASTPSPGTTKPG